MCGPPFTFFLPRMRELKTPFLGEERYRKLLAAAESYLKEERDLRGFDPVKGWIHATAHTADLLAALVGIRCLQSRTRQLCWGDLVEARRSGRGFCVGEQDRLANVLRDGGAGGF